MYGAIPKAVADNVNSFGFWTLLSILVATWVHLIMCYGLLIRVGNEAPILKGKYFLPVTSRVNPRQLSVIPWAGLLSGMLGQHQSFKSAITGSEGPSFFWKVRHHSFYFSLCRESTSIDGLLRNRRGELVSGALAFPNYGHHCLLRVLLLLA